MTRINHRHLATRTFFGTAFSLATTAAFAFGTINSVGQHAEHEKITRLGLSSFGIGPKTMSEIAGENGHFGAVGAPDWRLITQKSAHCDAGDHLDLPGYPQSNADALKPLSACRKWIFDKLKEAVADAGAITGKSGAIDGSQIPTLISCKYTGAKGRAKCNVLEDLGLAFHTAQDFYSHTNWVDRPDAKAAIGPDNPPGLDQTARAPWIVRARMLRHPPALSAAALASSPRTMPAATATARSASCIRC